MALTYLPDLRGCQACAAKDELAFCRSTRALLKSFEASREDISEFIQLLTLDAQAGIVDGYGTVR